MIFFDKPKYSKSETIQIISLFDEKVNSSQDTSENLSKIQNEIEIISSIDKLMMNEKFNCLG